MYLVSSTRLFLLAIVLSALAVAQGRESDFERHVIRPAVGIRHQQLVLNQVRLLETNETDHAEGCHCDGSDVHCDDMAEEEHCSCSADGVLVCEEEHGGCHCDGSEVHCDDVAEEEHCSCSADGVLVCEEEHAGCHCDGSEVHCDDVAEEEHCSCSADGVLVCEEEHAGCHCDGSEVHCDDPAEEEHCSCSADGVLTCEDEEEAQTQSDGSKPWSQVIVSALIINLVTLVGVFVLTGAYVRSIFCPSWWSTESSQIMWTHNLIPMFACGALLATVVFLILPEALHLIQSGFGGGHSHDGHGHRYLQEEEEENESAAAWRFGVGIIGGLLIPYVCHMFFPDADVVIDEKMQQQTAITASELMSAKFQESMDDFEPENPEAAEKPEITTSSSAVNDVGVVTGLQPKAKKDIPLLTAIFVGDFFHNFADGVFIGTAWMFCDKQLVYTIIAATVFHELAQEISDYFLMVHLCGLKPCTALALNFLCGLSVMLGGIVVLAFTLTNVSIGIILCIGGGVYINLAVGECLPKARAAQKDKKDKLYGLLAFTCGAVPIGLVLLDHRHCG